MKKASGINNRIAPGKWEMVAFTRYITNLHVSSLALISLYGRFGAGLFECWIQ